MLQTKNGYTDLFFRTRRGEQMSVAAEIQWSLLPPLAMTMPRVAVTGVLEPAYDVAGDSFDYALDRILCFTDGLIEEHESGEEEFGEDQLIDWVNQLDRADREVHAVARDLSHTLKRARGEATSDDSTLLLVEWRG